MIKDLEIWIINTIAVAILRLSPLLYTCHHHVFRHREIIFSVITITLHDPVLKSDPMRNQTFLSILLLPNSGFGPFQQLIFFANISKKIIDFYSDPEVRHDRANISTMLWIDSAHRDGKIKILGPLCRHVTNCLFHSNLWYPQSMLFQDKKLNSDCFCF